jgi:hypothetical protein
MSDIKVTFIHTADWQLGKPFAGVDDVQKRVLLQNERLAALQRLLVSRVAAKLVVLAAGSDEPAGVARIALRELRAACKALKLQWAHLWVWQGQAGDDPSAHATAQQHGLLQHLQQMGGAAALLSALDARVAQHFALARDRIYTQAGKPKVGSELECAERANVLAPGHPPQRQGRLAARLGCARQTRGVVLLRRPLRQARP